MEPVVKRLGEIVEYAKGKKPKRTSKSMTLECSIPYINIKAFELGIVDEYSDGDGCVLCEEGDFLMVWDGSRSGYVGKAIKGALGSTLMKLNFPGIENNYAFYFLQSKFVEINTRAKGVGIPHVDPNLLWNYQLLVPSISKQKEIVSKIEELFSELDKGVEQLKTAQQQIKIYWKAVLNFAFDRNGSKPILLKNVTKKIQIGPFGTQLHKADYIVNGVPLINPMHIKNDTIVPDYNYTVNESKRNNLANYILESGDVLLGRRGEMGRCGLVTKAEEGWLCGTGSLYFRPDEKVLNSRFLFYYLISEKAKKYLSENAGGTTMANLNLKIVNEMPIGVPSLEIQESVVLEIQDIFNKLKQIEEIIECSLVQADTLRQSILNSIFKMGQ